MSDLTKFLLARIAEDEAVAREATSGPWAHNPSKEWFTDPDKLRAARAGIRQTGANEFVSAESGAVGVAATGPSDDHQSMADANHIARHDPTRVLAECGAKRRIVEREEKRLRETWRRRSDEHRQTFEQWFTKPYGETLRDLATIYANHPDFRSEWTP